jgi:glutamine synthetase
VAPGFRTPTAFVVADALNRNGTRFRHRPAPRAAQDAGTLPPDRLGDVVAPELEFYLTEVNSDPDLPIVPPRGRGPGRNQPAALWAGTVNEFEDIIEEIYDQAEVAELHLDTMIHEGGTAQLEINFNHGDPSSCAIR